MIRPQSQLVFKETEPKHVTTSATPHPACIRYMARLYTVSSFSKTEVITVKGAGLGEKSLTLERKVPNQIDIAAAFLLSAFYPSHTNPWFCNPTLSGQQAAAVSPAGRRGRQITQVNSETSRKETDLQGQEMSESARPSPGARGRVRARAAQGRRGGGSGCPPGKQPQPRREAARICTHSASGFRAQTLQRGLGDVCIPGWAGPPWFQF